MAFYYFYQYKPKGMSLEKHVNVSERFTNRDDAKRVKSQHKANDPECVFSEIIEAASEDEALNKLQKELMNRI
ncbi:hypothetical protein [Cedecea davisae]|uniref:hypothetical protein n=1 Tax=Cedecea davisae TaxID=158484 RepID=UPI00242FB257|nr:hypothetical protein [Cedecea davisae]